jgi:hypothetical protein
VGIADAVPDAIVAWAAATVSYLPGGQYQLRVSIANSEAEALGVCVSAMKPEETLGSRVTHRAEIVFTRDTDGSPKGPDRNGLDGEAATAGAEGIAQDTAS